MIKYIGSKRQLLPAIVAQVEALGDEVTSVIDLFSGTSRVGHALKAAGYRVLANDHNAYANTVARCYVEADREEVFREATEILGELGKLPGKRGYFTETFCERSRFFQPKNGAKIDSIRDAIATMTLTPALQSVLLVSLMEAADRVDSTTGLQMAYLKEWAPRAHRDLELRFPDVLPRAAHGKGEAHRLEATEAAASLEADVAYIDPPYNQHSYLGNYHIWESLVTWDKPEVYGVACKRVDVRERQSPFNSKRKCREALAEVIRRVRAKTLIVSFNDEGHISREEMESLLGTRGHVTTLTHDYKRYVGAQIGIHDPSGKRVGEVSHLRNKEFLYVVSPSPHVRGTKAARGSLSRTDRAPSTTRLPAG